MIRRRGTSRAAPFKRKRGEPTTSDADSLVPIGLHLTQLTKDRIEEVQVRMMEMYGYRKPTWQIIEMAIERLYDSYFLRP